MPDFLEGTVDVPVAGRLKKAYVYVPVGIAAVYIGWRWYQAKQDAATADDSASTGLYSSDDLSDYGLSTTGGTTTVSGNTGSTTTDATGDAIDTNAQWTQEAVELLGNAGYDSATVYAALGEFLARRALDKNEATIARAALAAAGQPPVSGPFSVIEEATATSATLAAPTGLRVVSTTSTSVTLAWNAVAGAGYYRGYRSGASTNVGSTDAGNLTMTITGLSPNTSYQFQVAADTTTGKPGPKSAAVTGKTAAVKLAKPGGLKSSAVTRTSFRVTCGKVTGAQYYRWYINSTPYGPSDQPYRDFLGMKPNTTYKITVAADTTNQEPGPVSSALSVKTKK